MYHYPDYGSTPVKITERGYGGHFCMAHYCQFRRNTLLQFGNHRWIVSTVGNLRKPPKYVIEAIGVDRFYETMAFVAQDLADYWDANVAQQIYFESPWKVQHYTHNADNDANNMHNTIVIELAKKIQGDITPLMDY